MVITDCFAWGHIPKTGGDITSALFVNSIPDEIVLSDPDDYNKHTPFSERRELIKDKTLILNIRRLPNFLLSFVHHHLFTNTTISTPDRMNYLDKNCKSYIPPQIYPTFQPECLATLGDYMIDFYVGNFNIDYWLRCEHIQDDFLNLMHKCCYATKKIDIGLVKVKAPLSNYNKNPFTNFTKTEIKTIYTNNPKWTAIEESVYGELLSRNAASSASTITHL